MRVSVTDRQLEAQASCKNYLVGRKQPLKLRQGGCFDAGISFAPLFWIERRSISKQRRIRMQSDMKPFNEPAGNPGATENKQTTGTAAQRAREQVSEAGARAAEVYDQTRKAVSDAYDKTAAAVGEKYDQAVTYGKEHPGSLALIAFGAGIGLGLALGSSLSRPRNRTNRIVRPVLNALTDIALEFFG